MFRKRKNSSAVASRPTSRPPPARCAARDEDLTYTAPHALQTAAAGSLPYSVAPSGTLKIRQTPSLVPGFSPPPKCLQLEYDIPAGTQKPYHPNPGQPYAATTRYAYLPNNDDGCRLLIRFKVAWSHGYMFKIGRSLTSGLDNQVTWTTIPNKSSLNGGPFGFPDPKYTGTANGELDKLGIPAVDQCLALLSNPPAPPPVAAVGGLPPAMNPSFVPAASLNPTFNPLAAGISLPPAVPYNPTLAPAVPVVVPLVAPLASAPLDTDNVQHESIPYSAPNSLAPSYTSDMFVPITGDDECAICLEKLSKERSVQIRGCKHEFHYACLEQSLSHNPRCPICREPLDGARGKGPSGTMTIDTTLDNCPGFAPGTTSIRISYNMPSGTQKHYHENPNQPYSGTTRVAYLPNNTEGRKLLKRLKYAWTHGLTFRVGTSLTTQMPNQVTWTSIHHKTSLHGGVHGFPDPKYMDNVNASLDALHVPP